MHPGESAAYAAKLRALLPLMDAYARGEELEVLDYKGDWIPLVDPRWGGAPEEYRIKPAPRTFYGILYNDGSVVAFPTESKREKALRGASEEYTKIELIEVLK